MSDSRESPMGNLQRFDFADLILLGSESLTDPNLAGQITAHPHIFFTYKFFIANSIHISMSRKDH